MPLTINLLHEEQRELQQRKRDPLKLGLMTLGGVALLFIGYYGLRVVQVGTLTSQLRDRQSAWRKLEPQAINADKEEKSAAVAIGGAGSLTKRIEGRFYWAPLLDTLLKTVPPNVQVINLSGTNEPKDDKVAVVLEGVAAGVEPRAAAEQFRIALNDNFSKSYAPVVSSFRSLDEAPGKVLLQGSPIATARFTIDLQLKKPGTAAPTPAPAAPEKRRRP